MWNNQYIVDYCYQDNVGDKSVAVIVPDGSDRVYINRKSEYGVPTIKKILNEYEIYESKSYTKDEVYSKNESDERYAKIANRLEKPTILFIFDK